MVDIIPTFNGHSLGIDIHLFMMQASVYHGVLHSPLFLLDVGAMVESNVFASLIIFGWTEGCTAYILHHLLLEDLVQVLLPRRASSSVSAWSMDHSSARMHELAADVAVAVGLVGNRGMVEVGDVAALPRLGGKCIGDDVSWRGARVLRCLWRPFA